MRRKKKPVTQLTIFDYCMDDDLIWNEFSKIVSDYQKKGFVSLDEYWWRSRYHDHIICPNHGRNPKGYEYEKKVSMLWKFIWMKNKNIMCSFKKPL